MGGGRKDQLEPLGKLNIFVGANNSGKSRLLRGLIRTEKLEYIYAGTKYRQLQKIADSIKKELITVLDHSVVVDVAPHGGDSLRESIDRITPSALQGQGVSITRALKEVSNNIKLLLKNAGYSGFSRRNPDQDTKFFDLLQTAAGLSQVFAQHEKFLDSWKSEKELRTTKIYIPVLRGLRPSPTSSEDIYGHRTARDYFLKPDGSGPRDDIQIFTGLTLYSDLRKHLLGTLSERKLVGDYEKYLSERFFEGKSVTLIPKIDRDVIILKVGKEFEREIFHVGDGLQSLIAITFPIFRFSRLHPNDFAIVCIEEPELLIHPGLQRTLMSELVRSDRYQNIQFFITTHSNHFLDLTLDFSDISIFRVRKELQDEEGEEITPGFVIENVSNKDKQTLELLGVRNSSVFLANATIWVEGITDRMYFGRALELEQNALGQDKRKYREDDHYAFIEYGGSNISHWDFVDEGDVKQTPLESIVSRIFVIADNDTDVVKNDGSETKIGNNKKQERLKAIGARFGDERFVQLKSREVENLIPSSVLRRVAARLGSENADDVKIKEGSYANARMGTFMEEKFALSGFSGKYGTIKDKKRFAELVLEETKSVEDLSPEMRAISEKLLAFIASSNE